MADDALCWMSAADLAAAVARRKVSPVEVVDAVLARIERRADLNAYCLALKNYITRRGGTYLFSSTNVPFETLVLNYLRERGLLG